MREIILPLICWFVVWLRWRRQQRKAAPRGKLEREEVAANEALYLVDPDFAMELGYVSATKKDYHQLEHWRWQAMQGQMKQQQSPLQAQQEMAQRQMQVMQNQMQQERQGQTGGIDAMFGGFQQFGSIGGGLGNMLGGLSSRRKP